MSDTRALRRLTAAVAGRARMADLLPRFHEYALGAAQGRASVLLRLNPESGRLLPASAAGLDDLAPEPWLADRSGRAAVERAWAERSPVIVSGLSDLERRLGAPAAILAPLRAGDERLGLFVVAAGGPQAAEAARETVGVLSDLLSVALERARLQRRADLQQEVRLLLAELMRAVSSSLDLNASLEIFCDRAARLFDAHRVAIWLHDRRARSLGLAASSNGAGAGAAEARRRSDDACAPVSAVMRRRRATMVPYGEGAWRVMAPLRGRRRALGTLEMAGVRVEPGDAGDLLERVEEIARQLSAGIENVWLLEDVRRSRRELESTFNSLADLVVVCDGRLRITQVNHAFAARVDRRVQDLIDAPLGAYVCREVVRWVASAKASASGARPLAPREIADDVLAGTFVFTITPLADQRGTRLGTVIVARDVTAQARLEAEGAQLRDRLAQSEKLAALGQFVAGIAHELNNPLQGVLGHAELMLHTSSRAPSRFRRDLRLVFREADRAAKIVHSLLVFAGSRRITRRRLNVNHVLSKVLSLRGPACEAAGIEVVKRLTGVPTRVSGDALLLQQALLNIVVNAEQAMAHVDGVRRLEVTTRGLSGGCLEIQIADTGPGIPREALPRLFEPFFTTKPVGEGTGLGLAIAYGIVQEHDGELRAANRPEGGALFSITLPASAAETVE